MFTQVTQDQHCSGARDTLEVRTHFEHLSDLTFGTLRRRCVGLLPLVPAESVSGWMCPATDVGQMAGVQEKNRDAGRGGLGREDDSHA